jgi:hypothetical protein
MAKKKEGKTAGSNETQIPSVKPNKPWLFQKGQSGNPAGPKPGYRHKASLAAEVLLEGQAEAITQKAIEAALNGDMLAARLCMDRFLPPRRDRHVQFDAPALQRPEDAMQAIGAIVNGVAVGNLTVPEAAGMANIVANFIKAVEATDLQARIERLEELLKGQPQALQHTNGHLNKAAR